MKRLAALVLTLAFGWSIAGVAQADNNPNVIEIGYWEYGDDLFTTHVVKYILEEKMGKEVKLARGSVAVVFKGVATGDLDFHTDAWLPKTHAAYMAEVEEKVINIGPMYTGTKLGWVVPAYVPEDKLNSIDDLLDPQIKAKLDGKITGIGPGAGLTNLSKEAMQAYGLKEFGYRLMVSSGVGMTSALKRAIANHEWIVVTGWSPHWMFGRWDLRYLKDPKNILGGVGHADIIAREGFYQDAPRVYEMLDRMTIPIEAVATGMYRAEQTSYAQAARKYVESHPELVHYWITGEMQ